jgi:hypothetical protein
MINGEKLREYGFIASFYCFTVGFLYLWGYWSSFRVNILQYINWSDIIKLTLIPILSSFGAFVVGAIAGQVLAGDVYPLGGGRATPLGEFLNRHRQKLATLWMVSTSLLYLYGPAQKWNVLPILIAVPFIIQLRAQEIFRDLFVNDAARTITAFLLCIPFYAYGHGIIEADNVIQGREYKYVEMTLDGDDSDKDPATKDKKFKFLGQMNGYVFLMPFNGKTVTIGAFDKSRDTPRRRTSGPSSIGRAGSGDMFGV